jgi:hypothetical protein
MQLLAASGPPIVLQLPSATLLLVRVNFLHVFQIQLTLQHWLPSDPLHSRKGAPMALWTPWLHASQFIYLSIGHA